MTRKSETSRLLGLTSVGLISASIVVPALYTLLLLCNVFGHHPVPIPIIDALTYGSLAIVPAIALILGFLARSDAFGQGGMFLSAPWLFFWLAIFRLWLVTNP